MEDQLPITPGSLLACTDISQEPGLWFVFYHDEEGTVAFDITKEHPDIGYKGFEAVLNFQDLKSETEKVVLLGGPERADDALIILHEASASTADSVPVNNLLAMMSYTYVLKPGSPPRLTTADNRPSQIRLKNQSRFLVSMGYRIFDTPLLQEQMQQQQWICLPATPEILFDTPRRERRTRFMNKMN